MSVFTGLVRARGRRDVRPPAVVPVGDSAAPAHGIQGPVPAPPPTVASVEITVPCRGDSATQTRELQAALDAGGTVHLQAGSTYRLDAPLVVTGASTLVGAADPDGTISTLLAPDPTVDRFESVITVAAGARLTLLLITVSRAHRYGLVNNGDAVLRCSAIQRTSGGWDPAGIVNEAGARLRMTAFSASVENAGHGVINRGVLVAESARISLNTTPLTGQGGFDGGGVRASAGSQTTLAAGTEVWLNTARDGGGVFLDHGAVADLQLANLQLNTARRRGGALFAGAGAHAGISGCVVAGNTAGGDQYRPGESSGIGHNAATLRVSDSVITDAPAVVTEHGGRITVTDSVLGNLAQAPDSRPASSPRSVTPSLAKTL